MRVPFPFSTVAVEHIHDRRILIRHHMMWESLTRCGKAPRSEPLAALRQFSMQDPGYGVPRIQLPHRRWEQRHLTIGASLG